jgi:hypothetical protein
VPVTVTDSLNTIVNVGVSVGIYVEFVGAVREEIVGAVRSIVIGVVVLVFDAGPFVEVEVPNTELAVICGMTVPSLQLETVRKNDVPLDVLTFKTQPVAEPTFVKSPSLTLFTS